MRAWRDAGSCCAGRRRLAWEVEDMTARVKAASRLPERIDVPAIIRRKWNRPPSRDELKETLRRHV